MKLNIIIIIIFVVLVTIQSYSTETSPSKALDNNYNETLKEDNEIIDDHNNEESVTEDSIYDYDETVTSENWTCTDDCSGHEAGYEWAEENGIIDPYDCDGNSDSFIEGCEAYANEYQMNESDEDDDFDEYDY